MRQIIDWLRDLLGFGVPPIKAEEPAPVRVKPIFDDVEEWLRRTERFFDDC